jgi:hypothetical protein
MACSVCQEDDPAVLTACRDGVTRCAHHASRAGFCWWCGDGDPQFYGDDWEDGLCHDCHSETVMQERLLFGRARRN